MSEKQLAQCGTCSTKFRVPAQYAGRKVRCPKCQEPVLVPGTTVTVSVTTPQAKTAVVPARSQAKPVVTPLPKKLPAVSKSPARPQPPVVSEEEEIPTLEPLEEPNSDNPFEGLDDDLNSATPMRGLPPKVKSVKKKKKKPRSGLQHDDEDKPRTGGFTTDSSMLKGIGMMVGAVVWFVVGLAFGYIFFYPPILFIIGLVTFFKGLFNSD